MFEEIEAAIKIVNARRVTGRNRPVSSTQLTYARAVAREALAMQKERIEKLEADLRNAI